LPSCEAPIIVLTHMSERYPSRLPDIIAAYARLAAKKAEHGDPLCANTVHVAAPGAHLRITSQGRFAVEDGPRVRHVRPSADVLLSSAADAFGPRTLAVILSGNLNDGADGAHAVMSAGGVVLAQDPRSAAAPSMPAAAITCGAARVVLPGPMLATAIASLVGIPGFLAVLGLGRRSAA
jgi:two-component system chemotaxis response regulator CheB